MTSVLVTGGSGFIGTWVLRDLLARGMHPVVFDIRRNDERWQRVLGDDARRLTFVAGNLLDRELLRQTCVDHKVSHFIHLAALLTPDCQQDPWTGCQINVLGSVTLFELARELQGAIQGISYASSYAVYGPEADDGPVASIVAAKNRPPSFYGVFKLAVDLIADQYWRHFGIASVGIRPHVVYGPERTVGLTAGPSLAARAAAMGEPYTINYAGTLGYDYVTDVAAGFVRCALETPPGSQVVDLPSQQASPAEFIQAIEQVLPVMAGRVTAAGPEIPSNIPPQPRYISELFSDWQPTSIADGVRQTIQFYRP